MKQPSVSVIIPVFNVSSYLTQCLDSVIAQTFNDFEVIIIDDGSTDDSRNLCDEYSQKDKRFNVIHTENHGSAKARNIGLLHAKGEYIVAVDSDDWIEPNYLESMVECLKSNDADCVICAYWTNKDGKDIYQKNQPSSMDKRSLISNVLEYQYHAGLWNKIFKRSILLNGQIKRPNYSYFEDMFIYVSYLQFAKKVVYLSEANYHYRYCPDSLTNKSSLSFRIDMTMQLLNNLRDLYSQFDIFKQDEYFHSICVCANAQKLLLINTYPKYYKEYRSVICNIFPHTYPFRKVKGISTLCTYFAINGWILPYKIRFRHSLII